MWQRPRHYHFDWKLTLLYLLLLPLLLRLGFWQLAREQEKLALLAVYESRQQQAPAPLETLNPADDLQYRQVRLSGAPDNAHLFLLDNRLYQGRAGYEVLQALRADDGLLVFINRGWVSQGATRADLPEIAPLPARLQVQGSIYVPVGEPVLLSDELMSAGWPKVIEALQLEEMQRVAELDGTLFPYTLRLAEGAEGALIRAWPLINLSPAMHRGYAVQWFAMALALSLLYLYYSTRPQDGADA
ncbi:MAG: SURF1 family protein [Pseudomonadales bacterium]|jgi:cytochrome oxidase assembly protein ShyY1|nr:SURF1 family protein [Pseudomonadales bacterium]